jgi:hypothetical protein
MAGFGYLASSLTSLWLPQYSRLVSQFSVALEAGEVPIVLWLLIWGAKAQSRRARPAHLITSPTVLP